MDAVWEALHTTQDWGKYPAEDLIRTIMRAYKHLDRSQLSVLEIGCGAGANLSFFINEGFQVAGIDGAPSAIKTAKSRLCSLYSGKPELDLRVGNFKQLPWNDQSFDVLVDYMALYANTYSTIQVTIDEVLRVLKPKGRFYSRSWGMGTEGSGDGEELEPGTLKNPLSGPCANMGISHFFTLEELQELFCDFSNVRIQRTITETVGSRESVFEWSVWAEK